MIARLMGLATIAPAALLERVRAGDVSTFDVNAPARWREAHVPGAVNLDPVAFDASALPADHSALVVFYCSNPLCRKAPNAAVRAKKLGYVNVRVMSAGIQGWVDHGLPTESAPGATNFG